MNYIDSFARSPNAQLRPEHIGDLVPQQSPVAQKQAPPMNGAEIALYGGQSTVFQKPQTSQSRAVKSDPAATVTTSVPETPLGPLERSASYVNSCLYRDSRYPELGDIVQQGQSQEYDLPQAPAWQPFVRYAHINIPDSIFEQYNRTTCFTQMGLFVEIGRAWITVDNRLYLWNYLSGGDFQSYEDLQHTITAVALVRPRADVFVSSISFLLVIATTQDVILLGVSKTCDIQFYSTQMSTSIRGLYVSNIQGSPTGRIFFSCRGSIDIYEIMYQSTEGWFTGRCSRVCHTQNGLSNFVPIAWFASKQEQCVQLVVDDTRSLLYSLSSNSTIRTYHLSPASLSLSITCTYSSLTSHAQMLTSSTTLLDARNTKIVSISAISAQESKQIHLVASTSSGCRLYLRAARGGYGFGASNSPPTLMQVSHIRLPPKDIDFSSTHGSSVFSPGYVFAYKPAGGDGDALFTTAPDSGRIQSIMRSQGGRAQLVEVGVFVPVDGVIQAISLLSAPFSASLTPEGFGLEVAAQYDVTIPSTDVAILTNTGVHLVRRRYPIEIFDSLLRYSNDVEAQIRTFFDLYGRAEGCATALAVACSNDQRKAYGVDSPMKQAFGISPRLGNVEVIDLARRYYIEFGGRPLLTDTHIASGTVPNLDHVTLSGRYDGLSLYLSRVVRSVWKTTVIRMSSDPTTKSIIFSCSVSNATLINIQQILVSLSDFLKDNANYIEGLSGPDRLMTATSRMEEVAVQAEHRGLHALTTLISSMIEGISFVVVLVEDRIHDIVASLPEDIKRQATKLTFEDLFTAKGGRSLAKELVTAIVNRNISAGASVESVVDALTKRCGSFCSADDVITYKAVEQLRRAKEKPQGSEERSVMLQEALRLFTKTGAGLSMDNLKEAIEEFISLTFHPGAIELTLSTARQYDLTNLAPSFQTDGRPENDGRAPIYNKRVSCYDYVFTILDSLDSQNFEILSQRAYAVVYASDDAFFHDCLYNLWVSRGQGDRLLKIDNAHVLSYLERNAATKLDAADLLWQYHAKREAFYECAFVLFELSGSAFPLTLAQRIEFLSRALTFCNCFCSPALRGQMNSLMQQTQEMLDIALIQVDILNAVSQDTRIVAEKKDELCGQLDGNLQPVTDLFNKYADPLSYGEVCLAIFQTADFRNMQEIINCWEGIIDKAHANSEQQNVEPFEAVADAICRLGRRFKLSESVFPVDDLLPLVEKYTLEKQPKTPQGWVLSAFLETGVAHEILFSILAGMYEQQEYPWVDRSALKFLAKEIIGLSETWLSASTRAGRDRPRFNASLVEPVLHRLQTGDVLKQRSTKLLVDIQRLG